MQPYRLCWLCLCVCELINLWKEEVLSCVRQELRKSGSGISKISLGYWNQKLGNGSRLLWKGEKLWTSISDLYKWICCLNKTRELSNVGHSLHSSVPHLAPWYLHHGHSLAQCCRNSFLQPSWKFYHMSFRYCQSEERKHSYYRYDFVSQLFHFLCSTVFNYLILFFVSESKCLCLRFFGNLKSKNVLFSQNSLWHLVTTERQRE